MFQKWIENLQQTTTSSEKSEKYWVERLNALLLIEIARSDTQIDDSEVEAIRQALQASSGTMTAQDIQDIINSAIQDANTTISLHEQFQQINAHFSKEQKQALMEQMWRVALADGDLDKYEEHTIRGLSERLHIKHRDFIKAKLKVIEG